LRRVEQIWDQIVSELASINTANSLSDGAGNFRSDVKNVYKFYRSSADEKNFPSLCVIRGNETLNPLSQNDWGVINSDVTFTVVGLVQATTGHDSAKLFVQNVAATNSWIIHAKQENGGMPVEISPLVDFDNGTKGEFYIAFKVRTKSQTKGF
jgi:hypothetical protein